MGYRIRFLPAHPYSDIYVQNLKHRSRQRIELKNLNGLLSASNTELESANERLKNSLHEITVLHQQITETNNLLKEANENSMTRISSKKNI